jgi:hypothetical protein
MERTTLYEDDLTEERSSTPVEREENQHALALDPDIDAGEDDDDEDEDDGGRRARRLARTPATWLRASISR